MYSCKLGSPCKWSDCNACLEEVCYAVLQLEDSGLSEGFRAMAHMYMC